MTVREHFDHYINEGHDAGWIATTAEERAAKMRKHPDRAVFGLSHWLNLAAFARYMEANS